MFDPEKHHRRSVRLPDYTYTDGVYFVTICAYNRECIFGRITDVSLQRNEIGAIAQQELLQTEIVRPYVQLDSYVVMPNHIHAILILAGAWQRHAPIAERAFSRPVAGSLRVIIGAYKSIVPRRVNEFRNEDGGVVWQRGYHEHVIRSEKALNALRTYIEFNPARWAEERENPGKW